MPLPSLLATSCDKNLGLVDSPLQLSDLGEGGGLARKVEQPTLVLRQASYAGGVGLLLNNVPEEDFAKRLAVMSYSLLGSNVNVTFAK